MTSARDLQVDSGRILCDSSGKKWLRSEDAGYLDNQGRIWLVGRVKWMVERGGKRFWSYVVEQKVRTLCVSAGGCAQCMC